MGFFGFIFWMVIIWLAIRYWHKREARRMSGNHAAAGWYDSAEFYTPRTRELKRKSRDVLIDQQSYIESLETRVSELEERLDFTERLLAERREPVNQE